MKHFDRQYCSKKRVQRLLDDNESRRGPLLLPQPYTFKRDWLIFYFFFYFEFQFVYFWFVKKLSVVLRQVFWFLQCKMNLRWNSDGQIWKSLLVLVGIFYFLFLNFHVNLYIIYIMVFSTWKEWLAGEIFPYENWWLSFKSNKYSRYTWSVIYAHRLGWSTLAGLWGFA